MNVNLLDQISSQATQAITIQEKWNTHYVNELQHFAKHFPLEENTLQILEAVFPKRMQVQHFELESDFSLTRSLEKTIGIGVQLGCISIPLSYDLIYDESHSCQSRITIEVDQINFQTQKK
jgi:hypothetical protein